ncbi:unnamed protein product [Mytilus coruscus]|uniref:Uncharacterized protein n=1 Tax=Mytilus coruscus TaxID=42192 RepID=A0A6J8DBG8_MYTCO|nr:unnamed protein product [Mytilus coruscus]
MYSKNILQEQVAVIDENAIQKISYKFENIFDSSLAPQFTNVLLKEIRANKVENDWENTEISIISDRRKVFCIFSGKRSDSWVLYLENGEVNMVKAVRKEFFDEKIQVPVINKRTIAKAIIKFIGNEGVDVDKTKDQLRKLLQALIDYVQHNDQSDIWENATVNVYDNESNSFTFKSGNGTNEFLVNMTNTEPKIIQLNISKYTSFKRNIRRINSFISKPKNAHILTFAVFAGMCFVIHKYLPQFCNFIRSLLAGEMDNNKQAFTQVTNPSSIPGFIIRNKLPLTTECKEQLQNLRSRIYDYIDGETDVTISVYVTGKLYDEFFEFRLGKGTEHLIINVYDHNTTHKYGTDRKRTQIYRNTKDVLLKFGAGAAMVMITSTLGPGAAFAGLVAICYLDIRKTFLPIDDK